MRVLQPVGGRRPPIRAWLGAAALAPLLFAVGCTALTSPPEPEAPPAQTAAADRQAPPPSPAPPTQPQGAQDERIGASHVLVAYKGSMRAAPTTVRSKDEARKRAEEVAQKARGGGDFTALVKDYSDEPGAGARGGALGMFTRNSMVKPFSDAAFNLKPGEISGVVETDFGFHVIKRTQ
jgi:hypothetical protein